MATSSTSSSMPATPPKIIELPGDILHEIVKIVNQSDDSSLIVGPDLASLVLSHRSFLDPAETMLSKHQDYINTYRDVVIDARNDTYSSRDTALPQEMARLDIAPSFAEETTRMMFKSPLMMLVGMHQDKAIPAYVRSLVYLAPADGSDEALGCSQTALELFNSQEIVDDWNNHLSATMKDILPEDAAAEEETSSLQNLWQDDCGEGITLLLHSLPNLTSLSLSGCEGYLVVEKDYSIGGDERAPTRFRSSLRRLVLCDMTSVLCESDDLPDMFPHLQEIEIHCASRELQWFGHLETSSFLYFPNIKITGYRQNPVCLAVAIAAGSDSRWTRLECIFNTQIKGGLPKFIANYAEAFTSPRFHRPGFSNNTRNTIKMVITAKGNSNNHTRDDEHVLRLYSDEGLRISGSLDGIDKLPESQPIPKDFLKALIQHNQTGRHSYEVQKGRRGRGPKSMLGSSDHVRCPFPTSPTSRTVASYDSSELQKHLRRNWYRAG